MSGHDSSSSHITPYAVLGTILVVLMGLTFLTIEVTTYDVGAFAVAVALLIAGVKSYLVLTYFMHLKHEGRLLKILVSSIFILFAILVAITMIDYVYR